jgi:hypothetical protein
MQFFIYSCAPPWFACLVHDFICLPNVVEECRLSRSCRLLSLSYYSEHFAPEQLHCVMTRSSSTLKVKGPAGSSETSQLYTRLHYVTFQNTVVFIVSGDVIFFPYDDRPDITPIKLEYRNWKQIFQYCIKCKFIFKFVDCSVTLVVYFWERFFFTLNVCFCLRLRPSPMCRRVVW